MKGIGFLQIPHETSEKKQEQVHYLHDNWVILIYFVLVPFSADEVWAKDCIVCFRGRRALPSFGTMF